MIKNVLRVGLAQTTNDLAIESVCTAFAEKRTDVVLFPEMFSNGYGGFDVASPYSRKAWIDAAEPLSGRFVTKCRQIARDAGLAIVATFLEQGDPKPFNSAILIDRRGDIVLHQRKRHICFFDVPEEACAPGTSSKVAKLTTKSDEIAVGIMICMDREFPDVASDLVRDGAEIVLVPNSCQLVEDPVVGDVRVGGVRSMAFEGALGIAVTNYPSPKNDGHSFAVDSLGRVQVMCGKQRELRTVDFDLDELRAIQQQEWFRRRRSPDSDT